MPRDVSLSDSKCWNGGHEFVIHLHRELGRPVRVREDGVPCSARGLGHDSFTSLLRHAATLRAL